MLPRLYRLNNETDIRRILRRGAERAGSFLVLKFLNSGSPRPRFGFLVSKKISTKAVKRNLLKRRLRHIAEGVLPFVRPGYDCLLVARPRAQGASFEILKQQMAALIKAAGLLAPPFTKSP